MKSNTVTIDLKTWFKYKILQASPKATFVGEDPYPNNDLVTSKKWVTERYLAHEEKFIWFDTGPIYIISACRYGHGFELKYKAAYE